MINAVSFAQIYNIIAFLDIFAVINGVSIFSKAKYTATLMAAAIAAVSIKKRQR